MGFMAGVSGAFRAVLGRMSGRDDGPRIDWDMEDGPASVGRTLSITPSAPRVVDREKLVVGIVLRRHRVAMVRLKVATNAVWNFPGGKVEDGETDEEAVVRHLRGEIGLRCRVVETIGTRDHPVSGKSVTYILCKALGGKASAVGVRKADDIRWLTPNEVDTVTGEFHYPAVTLVIRREAARR